LRNYIVSYFRTDGKNILEVAMENLRVPSQQRLREKGSTIKREMIEIPTSLLVHRNQ
jgi:hypothetical protein